jgi:hypothetical protein
MTSPTLVRNDVQPPPLLLRRPPNVATSAAVEAIAFAEQACGIVLDDWQRWVVELALAERADGRWAAFEVGIVCPRQNGKNFILEVIQIACIYLFGDETLVHSAHKFDTSVEHFNRLKWLFENTPELSDLLLPSDQSFVTSNGKEHIRFRTGQRILFKARYRGSGRGFVGDKIFLDEAYDLPAQPMGAMIPTLSTRPMAQVYYTSSAPHEDSTVLHAVRKRAEQGELDDRLFYVEWGNTADADENDFEAIRRANPGLGAGHISEDYIRQEIRTFSGDPGLIEEHRRERLGIPSPLLGSDELRPISLEQWARLKSDDDPPDDATVRLALDAPPDRRSATFSVAGLRDDGLLFVGVREHLPTGKDMAPIKDRVVTQALYYSRGHGTPLILPPGSPAKAWKADLEAAGVELDEQTPAEYAEACGRMIDAVADGSLRHRDNPMMNAAVAGLESRATGDVESWSRRNSSSNIAPFVAATCALARVPAIVGEPMIFVWQGGAKP